MLKRTAILVCVFVFSFTQIALSKISGTFFEVTLPSGEVVKMTKSQIEELISKHGIGLSDSDVVNPELSEGLTTVPLPTELGGGYITGTPEAIAQAMNETDVTVGATKAYVVAPKISTAVIVTGVAVVGGVVALAFGSGGGAAAPTNH